MAVAPLTDAMSRIESINLDADNRQTSITLRNPIGGDAGGPTASVVYNALSFAAQQFDLMAGETDKTIQFVAPNATTGWSRDAIKMCRLRLYARSNARFNAS